MLSRAILSREFLISAAAVVASACVWPFFLIRAYSIQEKMESPEVLVSLQNAEEWGDVSGQDNRNIVGVTDYEFLGEPFEQDDTWYQLLCAQQKPADQSVEFDKTNVIAAYAFNLEGDALRDAISNSQGGYWCAETTGSPQDTETVDDTMIAHPDYPNLKLGELNQIRFADLKKIRLLPYIYYTIFFGQLLLVPFMLYLQMQAMKKREIWNEKLEEFDVATLSQHPHALRLCGAENSGLPIRKIDRDFDVPQQREVKNPLIKRWVWKIGSAFAISFAGYYLMAGTSQGLDTIIQSSWAKAGIGVLFVVFINVLITLSAGAKVAGIQEVEIKPGSWWAQYQKLPFFKYHDHVLKSLGMVELGAFRRVGGVSHMFRTVYLSPQGNLLVEVGVEEGREYFTLESVVNYGKFLETHSMATPAKEKSDIKLRHLRRSASHEDILKALSDHDQFVSEFATGGFLEAQFNQEKMSRFLEWGGEKKAV